MNYQPHCPWCRGPVRRTSRGRWTCGPCTSLYGSAQRNGVLPPWGAFAFDGSVGQDTIERQIANLKEVLWWRNEEMEKAKRRKRLQQAAQTVRHGVEHFRAHVLDLPQRGRQGLDLDLFSEVATQRMDPDIALQLIHLHIEAHARKDDVTTSRPLHLVLEPFIRNVGDMVPGAPALDVLRYYRAVIPAIRNAPEPTFNVEWVNDVPTGRDHFSRDRIDAPMWIEGFLNIPVNTPLDACKAIYDEFIRADATLDINAISGAMDSIGPSRETRDHEWRLHLAEILMGFALDTLAQRIAAGYDLHLIFEGCYEVTPVVERLVEAGLTFSDSTPNAFAGLVRNQPTFAKAAIRDGVPAGTIEKHGRGLIGHIVHKLNDDVQQRDDYLSILASLLDAGAPINVYDGEEGGGALGARAVMKQDLVLFRLLQRHGVRIEACIRVLHADLQSRKVKPEYGKAAMSLLMTLQQDALREAMAEDEAGEHEPVVRSVGRRRL